MSQPTTADLRDQYERETGKDAECRPPISMPSHDYVAWLERRAACAERLAEACIKEIEESIVQAELDAKGDWRYEGQTKFGLERAIEIIKRNFQELTLTAYEAACKGEKP